MLTAVILTKDEDDDSKLKRAVESVKFADEILLVKDDLAISDFSAVRNKALEKAKGEWALFVDSDEVVSQQLAREIKRVVEFSNNGYFLRRQDKFLDRWLRHGETASVKLLRLAKKNAGRWVRPVHETWKVNGRIGELKKPLWHYSHNTVEDMVEKIDRYSGMEAEFRVGRLGRLRILGEMVLFPIGKFIYNYFWRLGFLDGVPGFIHAGMMSSHSFLVRTKILTRCESTNSSE